MLLHLVALLSLAAFAAADSTAQWNEFADNFATDLAPIVALFGEQVTKQFLSESTGFLDNIIFGVAPLGILTAVVSAIRVYGNASLKSFIGRAQEAHGVAEAELCSSTSQDVCELWSNGGICRVFGRPKILEFMYTPGREFYPKFSAKASGDEASQSPSCGIDLPRTVLSSNVSTGSKQSTLWKEAGGSSRHSHDNSSEQAGGSLRHSHDDLEQADGSSRHSHDDSERGKEQERFAPYPNLSLNIGIRTVPTGVLQVTAVFGVSLQLSFFVYATWATFYNQALYASGGPPHLWSFCLAVSGTALLVFGMILCAMLIERKSCERKFTSANPTLIFWLQPGDQRIGDQLFNAFAHSEAKQEYLTSWKLDGEPSEVDPYFIRYSLVILWIAISSSLVGFICQFVGLRGLHGSVALYQLASTLCMAAIRALLRSRRLRLEQNRLKDLRRDVEGHELDWQALNIESQ